MIKFVFNKGFQQFVFLIPEKYIRMRFVIFGVLKCKTEVIQGWLFTMLIT